MLRLSSFDRTLRAVLGARSVSCLAYTIQSRDMLEALEAAARRGADVHVRLAGQPYNDAKGTFAAHNATEVTELRSAGVDARLVTVAGDGIAIHGRALLADTTLYLDDLNWTGTAKETVLADTSAPDAKMIRDAIAGRIDSPSARLVVRKDEAVSMEAQLLRNARTGDRVEIETESFGRGNPVYSAIEAAEKRGAHVELLVSLRDLAGNDRERLALAQLAKTGAQIRTCDDNAKTATIGARQGWIGSANATSSYFTPNQFDWGIRTSARAIVAREHAQFQQRWQHARLVQPK